MYITSLHGTREGTKQVMVHSTPEAHNLTISLESASSGWTDVPITETCRVTHINIPINRQEVSDIEKWEVVGP
jgi:hypothetical protein